MPTRSTWIKVHTNFERHPKTLKLRSLMGWNLNETIGFMVRFWLWAIDAAPNGSVVVFNDAGAFREVFGLKSDDASTRLLKALTDVGFLDKVGNDLTLHGWEEYSGSLIQSRESNAQKLRTYREKQRNGNGYVTSSVTVTEPVTTPDREEKRREEYNITKGGSATDGQNMPLLDSVKVDNNNRIRPIDAAIYKSLRENRWFPISGDQLNIAGRILCKKHKRWEASNLGALWYAVVACNAQEPGPFALACMKGRAAASETFERYTRMAQEKINELEEELLNECTGTSENGTGEPRS